MAGRPTKFKKEYEEQVYKLALLGAKDAEIADFFGVSEVTLNAWKKNKGSVFLKSLKRGKLAADANVAQSLYKRALGFEYDEVHYEKSELGALGIKLDEKEIKSIRSKDMYKIKIITKHVIPDTTACAIWLNNRSSENWRNKRDQEEGGEDITGRELILMDRPTPQKIRKQLARFLN